MAAGKQDLVVAGLGPSERSWIAKLPEAPEFVLSCLAGLPFVADTARKERRDESPSRLSRRRCHAQTTG